MKNLLLTICLTFSVNAFSETHGGVERSNALMKAVSIYATQEGGSLYRVLSIKKILNSEGLANFEIAYGGQDSVIGKESISYKEKVNASILPDADGLLWPDGKVKIEKVRK